MAHNHQPCPIDTAPPSITPLSISWQGAEAAFRELSQAEVAEVFRHWGVDPVFLEADNDVVVDVQWERDLEQAAQPFPFYGSVPCAPAPGVESLDGLLRRLERHRLIEPSRPWWARAFERLVGRYGEDTIIVAALSGVVGVYFAGSVLWRLATIPHGGGA